MYSLFSYFFFLMRGFQRIWKDGRIFKIFPGLWIISDGNCAERYIRELTDAHYFSALTTPTFPKEREREKDSWIFANAPVSTSANRMFRNTNVLLQCRTSRACVFCSRPAAEEVTGNYRL